MYRARAVTLMAWPHSKTSDRRLRRIQNQSCRTGRCSSRQRPSKSYPRSCTPRPAQREGPRRQCPRRKHGGVPSGPPSQIACPGHSRCFAVEAPPRLCRSVPHPDRRVGLPEPPTLTPPPRTARPRLSRSLAPKEPQTMQTTESPSSAPAASRRSQKQAVACDFRTVLTGTRSDGARALVLADLQGSRRVARHLGTCARRARRWPRRSAAPRTLSNPRVVAG